MRRTTVKNTRAKLFGKDHVAQCLTCQMADKGLPPLEDGWIMPVPGVHHRVVPRGNPYGTNR